MKAFSGVKNLQEAETNLRSIFESETTKVEQIAQNISEQTKMEYNGIDASLNPGLEEEASIALAFEKNRFRTIW